MTVTAVLERKTLAVVAGVLVMIAFLVIQIVGRGVGLEVPASSSSDTKSERPR